MSQPLLRPRGDDGAERSLQHVESKASGHVLLSASPIRKLAVGGEDAGMDEGRDRYRYQTISCRRSLRRRPRQRLLGSFNGLGDNAADWIAELRR